MTILLVNHFIRKWLSLLRVLYVSVFHRNVPFDANKKQTHQTTRYILSLDPFVQNIVYFAMRECIWILCRSAWSCRSRAVTIHLCFVDTLQMRFHPSIHLTNRPCFHCWWNITRFFLSNDNRHRKENYQLRNGIKCIALNTLNVYAWNGPDTTSHKYGKRHREREREMRHERERDIERHRTIIWEQLYGGHTTKLRKWHNYRSSINCSSYQSLQLNKYLYRRDINMKLKSLVRVFAIINELKIIKYNNDIRIWKFNSAKHVENVQCASQWLFSSDFMSVLSIDNEPKTS